MRRVFAALVVLLAAACGSSPIAPDKPVPAATPLDLTLHVSRTSLPFEGASVTVVVQLTMPGGASPAGVTVDLLLQSEEGAPPVQAKLTANESGSAMYATDLRDATTVVVRAGSIERATFIPRSATPSPPIGALVLSADEPESETGFKVGDAVLFRANVAVGRFAWDFNGDGTIDRTTDSGTTAFTYIAPGSYSVKARMAQGLNWLESNTVIVDVVGAATDDSGGQ